MKPKKRINRRRAKTVDERGNKIKVKVDRQGNFKRAKTKSDESVDKVIDKVGRLHQDVQKRQKQVESKRGLRKMKRNANKFARGGNSDAYFDRIERQAKRSAKKLKTKDKRG